MTGGLSASVAVARPGFVLRAAVAVPPGAVLAVLGPNGAGKTTLLRALAGLVPMTGSVTVDGVPLTHLPSERRGVGVVFQDYRLFPHLTVLENVAFPARACGVRASTARSAARPLLERFGLADLAGRRPRELSGGQAQRVALARALAMDPRMLLLDEPLAALDARTRQQVRGELRSRLTAFAGPSLVVTHDPLEAMVLADRLLVLEQGRVVQEGTPADVARRPATEYVARLVGLNLYAGRVVAGVVELEAGGALVAAAGGAAGRVLVALAPSAVGVHTARPEGGSARNAWPGVVRGLELLTDRVRLDVDAAPPVLADVTPAAVAELGLRPGTEVWLTAKATELEVYPAP